MFANGLLHRLGERRGQNVRGMSIIRLGRPTYSDQLGEQYYNITTASLL